jgi:hypothetical protein
MPTGVNVIKLVFSVTDGVAILATMFVPSKSYQVSLIFESNDGSLSTEWSNIKTLLTSIILACKNMLVSNTLAYFVAAQVTKKKVL